MTKSDDKAVASGRQIYIRNQSTWVGSRFGLWRGDQGQEQNQNQGQNQRQSQRQRTGVSVPHRQKQRQEQRARAPALHLLRSNWERLRRRSLLPRRWGWGLW